jgi:hypothetical protein
MQLKLVVMLSKSIEDEDTLELIMIDGSNCFYLGVDSVDFFKRFAHWHTWSEFNVSAFLDKQELGIVPKVLVLFS